MKKIILLSSVAAAFFLTSCRKDRTCTCTTTTVVGSISNVSTTVQTVGHVTKSEAKKESNCYSGKETVTSDGHAEQITSDCKLN